MGKTYLKHSTRKTSQNVSSWQKVPVPTLKEVCLPNSRMVHSLYSPSDLLECGAQFTQKLEGMFKDIDVSQDFMKSFKDQRHASLIERNLHVNVLSQSWWPTYPEKEVILPESMVQ